VLSFLNMRACENFPYNGCDETLVVGIVGRRLTMGSPIIGWMVGDGCQDWIAICLLRVGLHHTIYIP
jgi:hypothetical protein